MNQSILVLNSIKKVKSVFFFIFFDFYVSWIKRDKILISQLSPSNSRILQTRIDQRGDPIKTNFEIFQIQKWISHTDRAQKVNQKMGSFLWFPLFFPELWSLNCLKLYIFCKFVLTLERNLNLLKQFICIHLRDLIISSFGSEEQFMR